MPTHQDIERWVETIRSRYENYLKTSFYFKDLGLRQSFQLALAGSGKLLKGPIPEPSRNFMPGSNELALVQQTFPDGSEELCSALVNRLLWSHQERAIQSVYNNHQNIVVATGTASGKTESFLYPILFDLYQQYHNEELGNLGVRAMILYPMNALANDQRLRLGDICKRLEESQSSFLPTFGQYIGQTPYNRKDKRREAHKREEERLPGELVFRDEMRDSPPHILLTNYSMLEYLLIRPDDSPLFDNGRAEYWKYIVLDEAHQYRGVKGMEMGMLIRRLKQRLRDGGYQGNFSCIATSATITSGEGQRDQQAVAGFAKGLFGEPFTSDNIILGETKPSHQTEGHGQSEDVGRYHLFLRALEGAFLIHESGGQDKVVLNREEGSFNSIPLEIALCRECGQHYYVGREHSGKLEEAIRDPSQPGFGVQYYLPISERRDATHYLCRRCGTLTNTEPECECDAYIQVKLCDSHSDRPDQLSKCEVCNYQRGGIGDPVQEIVHGSDGPNAVIATALHELLPMGNKKVLAFADSRQEAAFFAWYAEDSYAKLRDRNLMLRALQLGETSSEGLSIQDLSNRLIRQFDRVNLSSSSDTYEQRERKALTAIFGEASTNERRISLAGVGLVNWFIELPKQLKIPTTMENTPWNLDKREARDLISHLLDQLRLRSAISLPEGGSTPTWDSISPYPHYSVCRGAPAGRSHVFEWGSKQSGIVNHFLSRILTNELPDDLKKRYAIKLMKDIWNVIHEHDKDVRENDRILLLSTNGTFHLNYRWLRLRLAQTRAIFTCDTCAMLSTFNFRGICVRNNCPGFLIPIEEKELQQNHYRVLYESTDLPPLLMAEEHTAQINSDTARDRQAKFKEGKIHLLSSSTTFEVGVDLGDLEVVFLRNVPPEPFNYTQRVGRAGRRDVPGLALTYCRRNPHDLYHYERPEERIIAGNVQPPHLRIHNEKIIMRHMIAVVLAGFFKEGNNSIRFKNVENFIGDWRIPHALNDLREYCEGNLNIKDSLLGIVPSYMHLQVGLTDDLWIDKVLGSDSRFDWVQAEVCSDYSNLEDLREEHYNAGKDNQVARLGRRMRTIAKESTLSFLSRKAVIPKYGFPVDVVELNLPIQGKESRQISLQRDLSQAIAEYAPGGKVVANKKEWESYGVKTIAGKELPVKYYTYDDARNFQQWDYCPPDMPSKRYISPIYGFTTSLFANPKEPKGRAHRLYTTRPFFNGFVDKLQEPEQIEQEIFGIKVTKAIPGSLVILCEGRSKGRFYICLECGRHTTRRVRKHKTPLGSICTSRLGRYSLGHELVTDVIRIQFPLLDDQWEAYSLAYAILLGASETLNLPSTDFNVTITAGIQQPNTTAIVLYDDVPGGAGLVEQFEKEQDFRTMLNNAKERVSGGCGCDQSCYGCLRSYRNQFAHPKLDRNFALKHIDGVLEGT